MKKMVLILLALASLSFAEETKKEDCTTYLRSGDNYLTNYSNSDPQSKLKAIPYYLRYQICKDLEKEQTKEGKK